MALMKTHIRLRTDAYGDQVKGQEHPERNAGEHVLCNANQDDFDKIPWKSKRLGRVAYFYEDGELTDREIPEEWGLRPVFAMIHEMRDAGVKWI